MKSSMPYGIRYTNDAKAIAENEDHGYLGSTLSILEGHFNGSGESFYLDIADVDQYDFDGVKCQDVLGWIVPDGMADGFKSWWLSAAPGEENDSYDYALIKWRRGPDGGPVPVIDRGDGD